MLKNQEEGVNLKSYLLEAQWLERLCASIVSDYKGEPNHAVAIYYVSVYYMLIV